MDISIWELWDIHNLEKTLSARLALKTAKLAREMTVQSGQSEFIRGPLAKEWEVKLGQFWRGLASYRV